MIMLCLLDQIPINSSKGFAANPSDHYADILIVRTTRGIYAYRNRCPHTGAPMEWQPDHFLDCDNRWIQCGLHSALFRIEDGYCIAGPCQQQFLQPFAVTVKDGWIIACEPLSLSS